MTQKRLLWTLVVPRMASLLRTLSPCEYHKEQFMRASTDKLELTSGEERGVEVIDETVELDETPNYRGNHVVSNPSSFPFPCLGYLVQSKDKNIRVVGLLKQAFVVSQFELKVA